MKFLEFEMSWAWNVIVFGNDEQFNSWTVQLISNNLGNEKSFLIEFCEYI